MNTNKTISGKHGTAMLLLFLTALLWSFGGLLIKWVDWNPMAIAGGRSAIAALFILPAARRTRLKWNFTLLACTFSYATTVILFVMANKLTTAANTILLQYTAPVYVAIFGFFILKEKASLVDWLSIMLVLGGMVLFFFDKLEQGQLLGNILAIISGVSFALMIVLMRKQKSESPLWSVFWGNVTTALVGLPFMFGKAPSAQGLTGLLLLGIFQLGLSYLLYTNAIKHVRAIEAVLIPVVEPILNPVWVMLLLGEIPGRWSIAGGLAVVLAVTLRCILPYLGHKNSNSHTAGSSNNA